MGKYSDLLVLPLAIEKLPNPFYFAFEVETQDQFDEILVKCKEKGLSVSVLPGSSSEEGIGDLNRGNIH